MSFTCFCSLFQVVVDRRTVSVPNLTAAKKVIVALQTKMSELARRAHELSRADVDHRAAARKNREALKNEKESNAELQKTIDQLKNALEKHKTSSGDSEKISKYVLSPLYSKFVCCISLHFSQILILHSLLLLCLLLLLFFSLTICLGRAPLLWRKSLVNWVPKSLPPSARWPPRRLSSSTSTTSTRTSPRPARPSSTACTSSCCTTPRRISATRVSSSNLSDARYITLIDI